MGKNCDRSKIYPIILNKCEDWCILLFMISLERVNGSNEKLGRVSTFRKEDMLSNVGFIMLPHIGGRVSYLLEISGGRTLKVNFFRNRISDGDLHASTYINNHDERTRMPGSTTALYTKARELMQNVADQRSEVITYTFSTFSQAMIEWALTKGQELFDWQDLYTPTPYEQFVLHSKISPKK